MGEYINTEKGIANCGGDVETYKEILDMVLEDGDEDIAELEGYLQAKDYPNFIIKVHGLKSQSYNIGSEIIGDKAKELEFAGKEERFSFIDENIEDFKNSYSILMEKIPEAIENC